MCFSATASFTVSLVLLPAAIYCIKKTASINRAYRLFALMPLFFAVQQFSEGLVWLALGTGYGAGDGTIIRLTALGFVFFSHLFWLTWVSLSCYAAEISTLKRKIYLFLIALGAAHGLSMFVPLLVHADWLSVEVLGHSIKYHVTLLHDDYVPIIGMNILYAMFTLVPLLLASDRYINIFGTVIIVALAVTNLYFDHVFISVWCFFAAILSFYIFIVIFLKTKNAET